MIDVTIPPLIQLPAPKNYTEIDSVAPVFYHRLVHNLDKNNLHVAQNTLYFSNEKSYTVLPNTCQTIGFPITVITSLPTVCVLTSSSFIYRLGLSYSINIVHSNDIYLHMTVINFTSRKIIIEPYQLQIICQIVVPGKPYNLA